MDANEHAKKLLDKMINGKKVYDIFAINLRQNLRINGYPIDFWEEKFKIKVPTDNLTPGICKELDMKLMDLNQEATFCQAAAQARAQAIKHGTDSAFMDKFNSIVQEHKDKGKKLPAAATLEAMAKIENSDLESALTLADIETKFWKSILDHLATCRKLIENASLNISVELKAINNDKFLDNLSKKHHENGGY